MEEIKKAIEEAAKELFKQKIEAILTRPDAKFGDYASNIALIIGAKTGKNPRDVAVSLQQVLSDKLKDKVALVEIAGPGFINFTLSDQSLGKELSEIDENYGKNSLFKGKTIVIEHTDPNPFKEFHIGHAYSNTVGESIGRLFGAAGAKVHQVSYHGDAGLHIAMAIWGMQLKNTDLETLPREKRHEFLAKSYALGANANKGSKKVAGEIQEINKHVYQRDDKQINYLYDTGRKWSFDYFDEIYKKLNVSFEKQYFETDTGKTGLEIINSRAKVFAKSDGALVYKGDEKKGLHTRVFVTKEGLPTYEAKELGLAYAKQKDYPNAQKFVVITASEINEYFKVLVAALSEIDKKLASKVLHLSHGVVRLPGGKMSSRTGEVITLTQVLDLLEKASTKRYKDAKSKEDNVLAALKYEFLKHRIGADITFDIEESISLEGNSGPYLQYAYARANSILQKSKAGSPQSSAKGYKLGTLDSFERLLARKIIEYPEVVESAVNELLPSHICTYLYELAQTFNRFYEANRVIGDPREAQRLFMVKAYAQVLKNGLELLNIPAPERM